jgi:hypothetical protein
VHGAQETDQGRGAGDHHVALGGVLDQLGPALERGVDELIAGDEHEPQTSWLGLTLQYL